MQKFSELYNAIKNPLYNNELLRELPQYRNEYLYFKLIRRNSNNKKFNSKYDYREELYTLLFNVWKNSILMLNKQQIKELKQRGSYNGAVYELYDALSQQDKNISTYEELNAIFKRFPIIEKHCWHNYYTTNLNFVHVHSRELRAKQEDYINIKHRLYINPDPKDTYNLLGLFTVQALKEGIQFYYKFDDGKEKDRDDTIVMYANDKNIFSYINILQNIESKFPKLIARCNKPPILTGHIDNWIGYATEPTEDMQKKYGSYNNMVTELLEDSIKEAYIILENKKTNENPYNVLLKIISRNTKKYGLDSQKMCFNENIRAKIEEQER